jgi:hypothetical protein
MLTVVSLGAMPKVSVSGESAYQPGWSSVLKMLSNSSIVRPTAPSFRGARKPEKCEHDSRRTDYITSMLACGVLPPVVRVVERTGAPMFALSEHPSSWPRPGC